MHEASVMRLIKIEYILKDSLSQENGIHFIRGSRFTTRPRHAYRDVQLVLLNRFVR